jgi:hypothetical protein
MASLAGTSPCSFTWLALVTAGSGRSNLVCQRAFTA